MTLNVSVERALKATHGLANLVKAIHDAPTHEQETTWVEWKVSLDLNSAAGRFEVAEAILAFANRSPVSAARHCGGEGYVVVGVEPGKLIGVDYFDAAALNQKFSRYVTGVDWAADYVDFAGKQVLVVTVAPPQPGDRIHTLVRAYNSAKSGTVFCRGAAKTEQANHEEMAMLQERLVQAKPESAVTRYKRALGDVNTIDVTETVQRTVNELVGQLGDPSVFPLVYTTGATAIQRVHQYVETAHSYRAVTGPLLEQVRLGVRFGRSHHDQIWRETVEALANPGTGGRRIVSVRVQDLEELALLPATLVLYTGAIGAVEQDTCYGALRAMTTDARVQFSINQQGKVPVVTQIAPHQTVSDDRLAAALLADADPAAGLTDERVAAVAEGRARPAWTARSTYLFHTLRTVFDDRDDAKYVELFDTAEILLTLIVTDLSLRMQNWPVQPWYGRFTRPDPTSRSFDDSWAGRYLDEARRQGTQWKPLQANLFDGDPIRVAAAVDHVLQTITNSGWRRQF